MLLVRLLAYLRRHWPHTHLLVRGDRHVATPEVREGIAPRRWTACVFGLAGNAVWRRQAAPLLQAARRLPQPRVALAQAHRPAPPTRSRLYDELRYAAQSWAQPWRVVLKAEGRSAGDHPRFVVTSLDAPTPQRLYEALYGARGTGANAIKALKVARRSERTAATPFLAKATRLLLACAAYARHQALRTQTLQHTGLAQAQPSTIMVTLFKIAAQVKQSKERSLLPRPTSCPVKGLLHRVTTLLCAGPVPVGNTS
jgi:DDE family transposase